MTARTAALIGMKCPINPKNGAGHTPLDVAVQTDNAPAVRLLLRHGAYGQTSRLKAIRYGVFSKRTDGQLRAGVQVVSVLDAYAMVGRVGRKARTRASVEEGLVQLPEVRQGR